MMRRRGFTLIELTVVICVVALLFGVALERLLRYQEMGERAAMELNLNAINTALAMRFAAFYIAGRRDKIESEVGSNPIALLARPPENYLGELFSPDVNTLPRASWYFDRQSADLVYLPERRRYLSSESGPPEALRFRIVLTEPRAEPAGPNEVPQPLIAPAVPFKWVVE